MSTSSDINIALACSDKAEVRLIFKVITSSFMQRGADLQFLSAFPGEQEFLYPPLTYLQPTGRQQQIDIVRSEGAVTYTVIEVIPHL